MSLKVDSITHRYGGIEKGKAILDAVSFEMADAEQLLLRGISGSGKTTLINIVAGLLTPSEGTISIDGQSVYALSEAERDAWRQQHIGYVFQTHHLLPMFNAWENVALPLAAAGVGRAERKARAVELLETVGLGDHLNYRPNQLSTGQRQRVAIARALINKPAIVLADEPTASLDIEVCGKCARSCLQQTCRSQNAILIVASHDPALDQNFDRIADLRYGQWYEM